MKYELLEVNLTHTQKKRYLLVVFYLVKIEICKRQYVYSFQLKNLDSKKWVLFFTHHPLKKKKINKRAAIVGGDSRFLPVNL